MPTERDQDQELKDYLADRDDLSKAYRSAAGEEPPAHLDGAILAASRKAAGSKPRRIFSRWHVPVSLAAVVALSVLVVFNIPDERATRTYAPATAGNAVEDFAKGEMETGAAAGEAGGAAADAVPIQEPLRRPAAPAPAESRDEAGFGTPEVELLRERRMLRSGPEPPALLKSLPAEDKQVTAQSGGRQADADGAAITACTMPRPEACTMEYRPVCAVKDTAAGPETIEYSNPCHACSDPAVTGYTPGACGEQPQ